jgi:tetratricopeptide (TPR) repeat protein
VAFSAATPAEEGLRERAVAAWNAGAHDRALSLYEELVADEPGDLEALLRYAKLLSWNERYDAAIERYDAILARAPQHREARLERAKVLSWSGRTAEAAEAFRKILEREPDSRPARLGLARSLSWSGRQAEARRVYRGIVEENPGDADALVGIAQTHAWSGALGQARAAYGAALETEPGKREALVGLAYVDLWQGRLGRANASATTLSERFPDDEEVADLRRAVARALRPWTSVSAEALSDSDGNDRTIARLQWGRRLTSGGVVVAEAARHAMDSGAREADVDQLGARGEIPLSERLDALAGLGVDVRRPPGAGDESALVGHLGVRRELGRSWTGVLRAQRSTLIYSPVILAADVEVDEALLRVEGRPSARWRVAGELRGGSFSDGNARRGATAGAWRAFRPAGTTLEVGLEARRLEYDEDLDNGYFDPQRFESLVVELRSRGDVAERRGYWDVRLETGVQSFTASGNEVSGDWIVAGEAVLGWRLSERVALELRGAHSDYAVQSAGGFDFDKLGLRLRWEWAEP